tara:strand:+ start:377 stop:730 length:354 start_codon:yes stop_codon:yes gene_type:complete
MNPSATYTPRETTAMTIKSLKKEFGLKSHSVKVWDWNGQGDWEATNYKFTLGNICVSVTINAFNRVSVETAIGTHGLNDHKNHQGRCANPDNKVIQADRALDLAKRVSKDIKKLLAI